MPFSRNPTRKNIDASGPHPHQPNPITIRRATSTHYHVPRSGFVPRLEVAWPWSWLLREFFRGKETIGTHNMARPGHPSNKSPRQFFNPAATFTPKPPTQPPWRPTFSPPIAEDHGREPQTLTWKRPVPCFRQVTRNTKATRLHSW